MRKPRDVQVKRLDNAVPVNFKPVPQKNLEEGSVSILEIYGSS